MKNEGVEKMNIHQIDWRKSTELIKKKDLILFPNKKINSDEIEFEINMKGNEGELVNNYSHFLHGIYILTKIPGLIQQIFRSNKVNPDGYYELFVNTNGIFKILIVDDFSNVSNKISGEFNLDLAFPNSEGNEYFYENSDKLLNHKRKNESIKKTKNPHTKFSYDNLKRKCKHLVIENAMIFLNKKIKKAYNGNIGEGLVKKELVKLNQSQKKNSSAEFNKSFIHKTLKDILSQKITKKIKYLKEDHNKKVIEKILEEKKDVFESLFSITFIDCLDHFIGKKQINELNGLTLFSELKEQILEEYKDDGESYYENLEIFLKEFEKRINNAKSKKNSIGSFK